MAQAECDHFWHPAGVADGDGGRSAGYCIRCYALRWLTPRDWAANRERQVERRREAEAQLVAGRRGR